MEIKSIDDIKAVAGEMHDSEFKAEDFGFNSGEKIFFLKSRSADNSLKEFYLQFYNVEEYSPINLDKISKGKGVAGVFNNIKIRDEGLTLEILSQDLSIQLKLNKLDGKFEIKDSKCSVMLPIRQVKSQPQSIGKIIINVNKNLLLGILSSVHAATVNLLKNNIETVLQENDVNSEHKITIAILDIGDISDKQIREALKILFAGIKEKSNFVKLIHNEKEFYLPDEMEECIDWFTIER